MVGSVESNGQVLEQEAWMFSLSYSSNICDVQLSPLGNLCCDVWSRLWPAYMRITRLLCIRILIMQVLCVFDHLLSTIIFSFFLASIIANCSPKNSPFLDAFEIPSPQLTQGLIQFEL
ncbi:hypothetical protein T05_4427 [Trichinella murrelli]|uniref:Uncharacterized protein n=1 Tax=Trichinella murrelli TaxID=144512 RepID=A0A0V0U2K8_9BILA|nr:hypothetical protein T05_4427 [Trichinella murrelli]